MYNFFHNNSNRKYIIKHVHFHPACLSGAAWRRGQRGAVEDALRSLRGTRDRRSPSRSQARSSREHKKKYKKMKREKRRSQSASRSPAGVRQVSVSESTSPADIAELKRQDADSEDLEETKESKVDEAPAPPLRLSEAPGRGVKAWPAKDDDEDEVQCKVCNNWVKGGKAGLAMHSQYSKKHATYKLYNDGMSWAEATKKADRQWKNQWRQERKRSYAASARSRSPAEEPSGKSGPKRDKKKDKETEAT